MTKRTIWILNFGTTSLMSLFFIAFALQNIFSRTSDKDIIVVPFIIVVLFYLTILTFQFYNKIFKWNRLASQSFYLTTLPVIGLSVFILYNLGSNIFSIHETLSAVEIIIGVICGLNVATFCWGLVTKDK
jgi:hypothetical protein